MGKAAAEIVDLAEELGAGLVVVGSRGLGGIRRALMGRHTNMDIIAARRHSRKPLGDRVFELSLVAGWQKKFPARLS
jgi:Universal stress protein family